MRCKRDTVSHFSKTMLYLARVWHELVFAVDAHVLAADLRMPLEAYSCFMYILSFVFFIALSI